MGTLFLLVDGRIERRACPDDAPLRLDAAGRAVETGWAVAVVPFAVAPRAPRRHALLAAPGADVVVDGWPLRDGVAELRDGDRFLLGPLEALLSTDALPEPVSAAAPDAPCPVCCEALAADGRTLFRCGRCGIQACARCWRLAPRGVCLTPGCGQPAALDRPLFEPVLADFVSAEAPS
jgi:hypothetical protein